MCVIDGPSAISEGYTCLTLWRVTTVKALHRPATMLAVLLLGSVAGWPLVAAAQRTLNRTPPPDAPRFMVLPLRNPDKNVSCQAANSIASRLSQDFPFKEMYVI